MRSQKWGGADFSLRFFVNIFTGFILL